MPHLACDPSFMGSIDRRITIQVSLGINMKPYFKNNGSTKGLGA
jgi:hypothetical protein